MVPYISRAKNPGKLGPPENHCVKVPLAKTELVRFTDMVSVPPPPGITGSISKGCSWHS